MRYAVRISREAEQDLIDLTRYIAETLMNPEAAFGQLERLEQAIDKLAEYPKRHALYEREPWRSRGLRWMPVDHYRVFYTASDITGIVTIIRVLYQGRNEAKML